MYTYEREESGFLSKLERSITGRTASGRFKLFRSGKHFNTLKNWNESAVVILVDILNKETQ